MLRRIALYLRRYLLLTVAWRRRAAAYAALHAR